MLQNISELDLHTIILPELTPFHQLTPGLHSQGGTYAILKSCR